MQFADAKKRNVPLSTGVINAMPWDPRYKRGPVRVFLQSKTCISLGTGRKDRANDKRFTVKAPFKKALLIYRDINACIEIQPILAAGKQG